MKRSSFPTNAQPFEASRRREAAFRVVALVVVALVLGAFVLSWTMIQRGRAAMSRSDDAFHGGELEESIVQARQAALAYVPGAKHVSDAHARLEAIARGAEAQGDVRLARRAWDALRLAEEQTDYPGRGSSVRAKRAVEALERLDRLQEDASSP